MTVGKASASRFVMGDQKALSERALVAPVADAALPPSALPGISPSRGEIRWGAASPQSSVESAANVAFLGRPGRLLPISPLEGEMSGRTEGGRAASSASTKERSTSAR